MKLPWEIMKLWPGFLFGVISEALFSWLRKHVVPDLATQLLYRKFWSVASAEIRNHLSRCQWVEVEGSLWKTCSSIPPLVSVYYPKFVWLIDSCRTFGFLIPKNAMHRLLWWLPMVLSRSQKSKAKHLSQDSPTRHNITINHSIPEHGRISIWLHYMQ